MEDRAAHVFDLEIRKEIFHGAAFSNKPNDLKFVDDAGTRLIACAGWANPQLWDIPSNRQLLRLTGSWWTTTALSPDHRLAATGGGDGGDVVLWETSTGKTLHVLHADPAFINVIRFSPDGSLLACGGRNRTVRLWDVASGKLVKQLVGHTDDIVGLDFSPDGKRLASGSQAASDGIKLWDVAAPPTPYRLIGEAGWYRSWSLSPDGRILIAAGAIEDASAGGFAGITELFDLQTGTRLRQFKTNATFGIQAIALDSAGASLVVAAHDGSVRVYETATGREIRTLRPADPTPRGDNNAMASAAFAPDGKSVSVATNDGWIFDLATDTGKELWRARRLVSRDGSDRELSGDASSAAADKMRIVDVQYIHGGDWLLTNGQIGMYRGAVAIYDARNGRRLLLSPKSDGAISLSPDQRTVACGAGGSDEVLMIDISGISPVLETSIALTSPAQMHQRVGAVAFSPDGQALAVARSADIELYDVASRALKSSLHGHESTVSALAWLPDGSRLISGGWDHTVIVWDPQRAQALLNLPLGDTLADRVEHLLITPDGSRIIGTNAFPYAGSGGKTLMVWTAPKR
jgi:WD40 repeat protein